jgi:hypothetical protein
MRAFASQDILFKPTHRSRAAPQLTNTASLFAPVMPPPIVHESAIVASENFALAIARNGPEWTPLRILPVAPRVRRGPKL